MKSCEFVLLILISIRLIKASGYSEDFYSIPRPEISVTTRGFRVSIPNEPGIQMLFFHGSINRAIRFLEPGSVTMSTKIRTNGQWVLENNDSTLKVSDTIYFWLYVKKNGRGYTRPYESYVIKEVLPYDQNTVPWSPSRPSSKPLSEIIDSSNYLNSHSVCQNEIQNMKRTITTLQSQVAALERTIQRLVTPNTTLQRQNVPRTDGFDYKENWVWN